MDRQPRNEYARCWLSPDVDGLELLEADFVRRAFPRHTHDGYMISVIERGAQALTFGGSTVAAPAGRVVVVAPGEAHAGRAATAAGWRYRVFTVPQRLFALACTADEPAGGTPDFPGTVLDDPELARLFARAHRAFGGRAPALERESRLLDGLRLLAERHAADRRSPREARRADPRVRRARDYLEAHGRENVRLDTLAEVAGLAPLYLLRLFRRQYGLPPHAYLTQLRVRRAERLLARGVPVSDVAYGTGFADQSHLTRHFKRLVGVTPGRFRLDHGHPASREDRIVQAG